MAYDMSQSRSRSNFERSIAQILKVASCSSIVASNSRRVHDTSDRLYLYLNPPSSRTSTQWYSFLLIPIRWRRRSRGLVNVVLQYDAQTNRHVRVTVLQHHRTTSLSTYKPKPLYNTPILPLSLLTTSYSHTLPLSTPTMADLYGSSNAAPTRKSNVSSTYDVLLYFVAM